MKPRRRTAAYLVGLCLTLTAPACTAIVGVDGDYNAAPQGETDEMCPASQETNACFKCTDEVCCSEYATCHADARCTDYYQACIPDCQKSGKSYDACVVSCDATHGAGHAEFAPYQACNKRHCLAVCGGGKPLDPCIACIQAQCADAIYACDRDARCDTLRSCMTVCDGRPDYDACTAACTQSAPADSKARFDQSITCSLTYCQQACVPG